MDKGYLQHLVDTITDKDNLKKVKEEALKLSRSYSPDEYIQIASELYCSEYFQIQEIGVLLYGYASSMRPTALKFLSETVSTHPSWKVQEVLAIHYRPDTCVWNKNMVKRILENPCYCGTAEYAPIITAKQFAAVEQIRKGKTVAYSAVLKPFRKDMLCGCCGARLYWHTKCRQWLPWAIRS